MSRVIREVVSAPPVFVGESRNSMAAELQAEQLVRTSYPMISITTDARGNKSIPIEQIFKLDALIAEIKQTARQAGFQEGYKSGIARGDAEAKKVVQQFETAVSETLTQRETLLQEAKQHILELVLQVSKKVTCNAVTINPETTIQMISGVIDTLTDRTKIKIKVHPDHLPIVELNINKLLAQSAAIKEITIEADPRVHYGGCFIETPSGDIDARIESQFDVIRDVLTTDSSGV